MWNLKHFMWVRISLPYNIMCIILALFAFVLSKKGLAEEAFCWCLVLVAYRVVRGARFKCQSLPQNGQNSSCCECHVEPQSAEPWASGVEKENKRIWNYTPWPTHLLSQVGVHLVNYLLTFAGCTSRYPTSTRPHSFSRMIGQLFSVPALKNPQLSSIYTAAAIKFVAHSFALFLLALSAPPRTLERSLHNGVSSLESPMFIGISGLRSTMERWVLKIISSCTEKTSGEAFHWRRSERRRLAQGALMFCCINPLLLFHYFKGQYNLGPFSLLCLSQSINK